MDIYNIILLDIIIYYKNIKVPKCNINQVYFYQTCYYDNITLFW